MDYNGVANGGDAYQDVFHDVTLVSQVRPASVKHEQSARGGPTTPLVGRTRAFCGCGCRLILCRAGVKRDWQIPVVSVKRRQIPGQNLWTPFFGRIFKQGDLGRLQRLSANVF